MMLRSVWFLAILGLRHFAAAAYGAETCKPIEEGARLSIVEHVGRESEVPLDVPLSIFSEQTDPITCVTRMELGTRPPALPFKITYYVSPDRKSIAPKLIDISESIAEVDARTHADLSRLIQSGRWKSRGKDDSRTTLVLFYDFECPYCAQMYKELVDLVSADSDLRLAVVNFPLDQHVWAEELAKLSECTGEQSSGGFWLLNDYLFAHQAELRASGTPLNTAKQFVIGMPGIDAAALSSCIAGSKAAKIVRDDKTIGIAHGVKSTPTVFVNGRPVSGFRDIGEFKAILREIAVVKDEHSRSDARGTPLRERCLSRTESDSDLCPRPNINR